MAADRADRDAPRTLDWRDARARLAQAARTTESTWEPSAEEVRRILRRRADVLAKPREDPAAPTETRELLVFNLSNERYAIEADHVREVVPLRGLTPVPCTPPSILGVLNHRGRILAVLELRRLFALPGREPSEESRAVVVEAGGATFGILADQVVGLTAVAAARLAPPPTGLGGDQRAAIRGVTDDLVAVLDVEALAHSPRIVVNDEVG